MGVIDNLRTNLSEWLNPKPSMGVSASTNTTPSNPLVKSLEELNGRYHIRRTSDGFEYVRFGRNDDVPEVIDKLRMQSTTHAGIIVKKAKMVAGNGMEYNEEDIKRGMKTMFNAFFKNCESQGNGIRKVFKDMAFHFDNYGGVYLYVKWNDAHDRIIQMKVLPYNSVRVGLLNTKNEVDHFIVRRTFKRGTEGLMNNSAKRVNAYKKGSKNKEEIIYIKNPYSTVDIYSVPNYLSAYYFISSDFEFGQHILNTTRNGFSPKVLASFIGRNMTDEQKRVEADKFKENFTGTDGEQVLISWVKKEEETPQFTVLDTKNLDKVVATMAELADNKILTAHNITSPALFGVTRSGKLNSSTDEMRAGFNMFRATETLPTRELLLTKLNDVMEISGYGSIQFEIIDIDTDPDTDKAITEDTVDPKTVQQ